MNKVILMGRLTRDPQIRYSQGPDSICIANFSLAVDRRFKRSGSDEPDADFFSCTAFRKTAEFVEKYLTKGSKILLEGNIQNDNYTNKNGEKVYSVRIIADSLEFAESKKFADEQRARAQAAQTRVAPAQASTARANPAQAAPMPAANEGFMEIPDELDDEELPFT